MLSITFFTPSYASKESTQQLAMVLGVLGFPLDGLLASSIEVFSEDTVCPRSYARLTRRRCTTTLGQGQSEQYVAPGLLKLPFSSSSCTACRLHLRCSSHCERCSDPGLARSIHLMNRWPHRLTAVLVPAVSDAETLLLRIAPPGWRDYRIFPPS